jgi:hypothetical protein
MEYKNSEDILKHLYTWAKFVDNEILIEEWNAGISFLYDFGFISLAQFAELSKMFTEV